MDKIYIPSNFPEVPEEIKDKISEFLKEFSPLELENNSNKLTQYFDEKSGAY